MLEPECVTLYDSKIYNNSKDTPAHNLSELLSTLTPCQRGERGCHHVLSPPSTAPAEVVARCSCHRAQEPKPSQLPRVIRTLRRGYTGRCRVFGVELLRGDLLDSRTDQWHSFQSIILALFLFRKHFIPPVSWLK